MEIYMPDNDTHFLKNLYNCADTKAKQAYFLGFLCHYGADLTIHPWVYFHTTNGERYDIPEGHGYMEAGLDDYLYRKETGKTCVNPNLYAPKWKQSELNEISILLEQAVTATYGVEYNHGIYEKAMKDFRMTKRFLRGKESAFAILERILHMKKGYMLAHIQPAVMPFETKKQWKNHFSGVKHEETTEEILERAVRQCVDFVRVGLAVLEGTCSEEEFENQIGNFSYETGMMIEE